METNEQTQSKEGEESQGEDNQSGEGEAKKTLSDLDRADLNVQAQKRENDRKEKLIEREENLLARKMIGGETESAPQSEKKEETDKEYRTRIEKEMASGKTDFTDGN